MFLPTATQQRLSRQWAIAQEYPILVWEVIAENVPLTFNLGSDLVSTSLSDIAVGDRIYIDANNSYYVYAVGSGTIQLNENASTAGTFKCAVVRQVTLDGKNPPRCHPLGTREIDLLSQTIDRAISKAYVLTVPYGVGLDKTNNSKRYALGSANEGLEFYSVQSRVSGSENPLLHQKIYLVD